MRLNNNSYPSYFTMESSTKLDPMFVDKDVWKFYSEEKHFDINYSIEMFRNTKNKYFITNKFAESIHKAENKIMDFANKVGMIDFINNFEDENGIFFFDGGWLLYEIKNKEHTIFWFNKNKLRGSCYLRNDTLYGRLMDDYDSSLYFIRGFLCSLWFMRNCEIEQRILKPKEKYRENGNKHFNESSSDLIVLDCRWFTELIRDIPFLVKGHFRWQPVGQGRTKKKLIWIDEFEKQGYHTKAKKDII